MSWFSTHVYDAGHLTGDTKDTSADIIGSVTSTVTFGYWDFEWEDLEGNIFNSSLGQGLYAFGNFMNRDFPNFIKYPADSLSANEEGDGTLNKWRQDWRKQWGDWKEKAMQMAPGGDRFGDKEEVLYEEEEAASVKGPGKMRGRDPQMAFNKGVKGYGRSSLKIGKGGGGSSRKGGKFDAYKSGRYSMPS